MRWLVPAAVAMAAGCFAQSPVVNLGPVTLRPGAFFDWIGEYRSQSSNDTVNTRYGSLPLGDSPGQYKGSIGHSRLQLHAEAPLRTGRVVTYLEADFLDAPGKDPWRWRQYWTEFRASGWRVLAGQSWSLLRPNRRGISSENTLMNTDVIEPAYHIGLAGVRRRALRLTRDFGANAAAAFEWASRGEFLAKVAIERRGGHFEFVGGAGTNRRAAAGLAQVVPLGARVHWVGQQLWTRGLGPELLGIAPARVRTGSALEGIEVRATPRLELFGYGGLVYADRSAGNRFARQWTVGVRRRLHAYRFGSLMAGAQVSQADRAVWDGRSGFLWYWMANIRWTAGAP